MRCFAVTFVLAACSCGRGDGPRDSAIVTGDCAVTSRGDLPGVSITLASAKCAYRVGEAATFRYDLVTTADVPPLHVAASTGCGDCETKNADPASWVRYRIDGTSALGNAMSYCVCDTGCCPPDEDRTVSVDATTVSERIDWTGRQWNGPSDTSNPMGEYFEPGTYLLRVGFYGGDTGQVVAELPITVEQ